MREGNSQLFIIAFWGSAKLWDGEIAETND